MRIFLDECIDWRLGRDIPGHEVRTVPEAGWASLKNGELLRRAPAEFDVFVTVDQKLEREQDLRSLSMAVVVLGAKSNRLTDLQPLVPQLLAALHACKPGSVMHLGGD